MPWTSPKTDWTEDDFYNFDDLDRVEEDAEFVRNLILMFDAVPVFTIVKNRDITAIDFSDSFNRIESNIEMLGTRYKPTGWVDPKTDWEAGASFDYTDSNRLEKNLSLLYNFYKGNSDKFQYCGYTICGEGGI